MSFFALIGQSQSNPTIGRANDSTGGFQRPPVADTRSAGILDFFSGDRANYGALNPGDNRQLGAFGAFGSAGSTIGSCNVPAGGLDWRYQMNDPSRDCMQTTAKAIKEHTGLTIDQATANSVRWGTPEAESYLARLQALNLPVPLTMTYPGQRAQNADGSGHISWANNNGGQLNLVDCATQQACRYAPISADGTVSGGYQPYQMRGILRYNEAQLQALEAQRGITRPLA